MEYHQFILSKTILNTLIDELCNNKKCEYEIKNIYERFILTLINSIINDTSSSIFKKINIKTSSIQKLKTELIDKKHLFKQKNISSDQLDIIINNRIIKIINNFLKITTFPTYKYDIEYLDSIKTIKIKVENKSYSIKTYNSIKLKKYPKKYVIPMVLQYMSIRFGSQHWSIPQIEYDWLYNNYNVRYEAFASPLNSRLIGKTNAKFCSLFYKYDKPFGSMGDFFNVNMLIKKKCNWVCNPPFIEQILEKAAKKCLMTIKHAKQQKFEIMIFFIMPNWTDSNAYQILNNYKDVKYKQKLSKRTYWYESTINIIAQFDSVVFILDSYTDNVDYSKICDKMLIKS